MAYISEIILVLLLYFSKGSISQDVDPCVERTIIRNKYQRSANYTVQPGEEHLCDRYIVEGWYEFISPSGNQMPEFPVERDHCGTGFPIWMDDTHPDVEENITTRKTCLSGYSGLCEVPTDIRVKNCSGYYVYELLNPVTCPAAYCIGQEIRCPNDTTSETGFTPGCIADGFPIFEHAPTLNYSILYGTDSDPLSEVVMLCDIEHNETAIFVDVYWFMGAKLVKSSVGEDAIQYMDLPAELYEDEWSANHTLGNTLTCMMRPRYGPEDMPGDPKNATFFMGFVVDDESQFLTIEEGKGPVYYTFYPTIPILCPITDPLCELDVELSEPRVEGEAPSCPNARKISQLAFELEHTGCTYHIEQITEPSPDTKISIPIHANSDMTIPPNPEIVVHLLLKTAAYNPGHQIWQDYLLPVAEVRVIEKENNVGDAMCKVNNDPHMLTFDGRKYNNMKEGEFIMVLHQTLPIEIQAYFKKKNDFSIVCGAAIRSGGDLWIYDHCRDQEPTRIRAYECADMSLRIESEGSIYKVYLPTGMWVKIDDTVINIYPSPSDYDQVLGLCGTLNNRCCDDFHLRDGSTVAGSDGQCNREGENDFNDAWRVSDQESLYEGDIRQEDLFDEVYFCSCSEADPEDPESESEAQCTKGGESTDICIDAGDDVTSEFFEWCTEANSMKEKTGLPALYSDDIEEPIERPDWDESFNPPPPTWNGNWTEQSATDYCHSVFNDNSVAQTCLATVDADISADIDNCIQDIQITDGVLYSKIHLANFLFACHYDLSRNNTMYTFNETSGAMVPPQELEEMCPKDCNERGTCVEGECKCHEGYFGADCGWEEDKVPVLFDMQFEGLCDLQTRPCASTPVYGDYFLRKPALSCQFTPFVLTKSMRKIRHEAVVTPAKYSHFQRIMCPLPKVPIDDDYFTVGYEVSASNDRQTFSDIKHLTTYDSKCMECTADLECNQTVNTCVHEGYCYLNGEGMSPSELSCMICNGKNDSFYLQTGHCFIDSTCYQDAEAVTPEQWCITCNATKNDWDFQEGTCHINSSCYAHGDPPSTEQSCFACNSKSNTFELKDGHCYINSTCYAHAEPISPDQPCIVCNSATNTFEFLEGYCFINETCFRDGESLSPEEYCFKCNSIDNEFEMEHGHCYIESTCYADDESRNQNGTDYCFTCNSNDNEFELEVGHCYINSTCYAENEPITPEQFCFVCNSQENIFEFQYGHCFIDFACYADGEARSPKEYCLTCNANDNEFELEPGHCYSNSTCVQDGRALSPAKYCLSCNANDNELELLEGYCYIDSTCYADGEALTPMQSCMTCNSRNNSFQLQDGHCYINSSCYMENEPLSQEMFCFVCNAVDNAFEFEFGNCYINSTCYADGQIMSPRNYCLKCNANDNEFELENGNCYINSTCYADGEEMSPEDYCLTCNANDNEFELEVGHCYIDSVCYADGVANPADDCLSCQAGDNPFDWTMDDGCRRAGVIGDGIFGKYLFSNNPQIKSAGNTQTSSDSAVIKVKPHDRYRQ